MRQAVDCLLSGLPSVSPMHWCQTQHASISARRAYIASLCCEPLKAAIGVAGAPGRLKAAHGYPTRPGFGLRRSSEYNFVPRYLGTNAAKHLADSSPCVDGRLGARLQ